MIPLTGISILYKDCFDIIKGSSHYFFLPSNIFDFSNGLIIDKLRRFLGYITTHIRKAKTENWSQDEFYRKTGSCLRAIDNFGKSLGDLLVYWESKKSQFWSYVSMDEEFVKKRIMSIVNDRLGIYQGLCEEHEVKFSGDETNVSEGLYTLIRNARDNKTIAHFANNADLMILAECIVYCSNRLQQGIVYLVTNDDGLHNTTLVVVNQPKIVYPQTTSGRLVGLEPLRPRRLVNDFRNRKR